MHITIVGIGYVGIVTAIGLAMIGHHVHCVDIDHVRIRALSNGICPIYEKDIEEKLNECLAQKLLSFSTKHRIGDKKFFLTVGTPTLKNGNTYLGQLFTAIDQIVEIAPQHTLLIIKSTVPIGTHTRIVTYLKRKSLFYYVASNPEFLREGNALYDFFNPDRIVVGTNDFYVETMLTEIYQPLMDKKCPYLITDPNTAELIKHASNAFLATKVAFINELADLCEKAKANITDVALGMGLDKRIGKDYLQVGPGFGGSCLPKDIRALETSFYQNSVTSRILTAVIKANDNRSQNITTKIATLIGNLQHKILTVYGLTFKANTDDTRESPAIKIIKGLAAKRAMIHCYDPKAGYDLLPIPNKYKNYIKFYNKPEEAVYEADALIIATEWELFQKLDFDRIKSQMKNPIIIDLRTLLDSHTMQAKGFQYYCLGKHMP